MSRKRGAPDKARIDDSSDAMNHKNDNMCPETDAYVKEWDEKVARTLRAVRREARILCILGLVLYVASGFGFYFLFGDSPLTGIALMAFFQVMVIVMATDRIYSCIKGGFLVGVEAQRDMVPVTKRLEETTNKAVHEELTPVAKKWERLADRLEEHLDDDFLERFENMMDSVAFSKEPLPPGEPISPAAPRKLPVADNGEGDEK